MLLTTILDSVRPNTMMTSSIHVFVAACCFLAEMSNGAWNYADEGPATWPANYEFCALSSQSPININHNETELDAELGEFTLDLFTDPPTGLELSNNGHSLAVELTDAWKVSSTSLLPGTYKAAQFHLHWGDGSYAPGSEHTLEGRQAFVELHIIHYNTVYPSLDAAQPQPDGLAVLAFLIEASSSHPDHAAFDARLLQPIRDGHVTHKGDTWTYPTEWSVSELLPDDFALFYRYQGSLTTPPCFESVTWTVFDAPIKISLAQARFLAESLYEYNSTTTDNHVIENNFRPVQGLNGRTVYRSSDAGSFFVSLSLLFSMFAATFLLTLAE